jgi:hypothetical protein
MRERVFWLPVIAIVGLVGTSSVVPALARGAAGGAARGSGSSGSPAVSFARVGQPLARRGLAPHRLSARSNVGASRDLARHVDVGNELLLHHRGRLDDRLPIAIWPYWPWIDTAPTEVPSTAPAVIVLSDPPNGGPVRAVQETPQDFSYVAGCHAFPGGYGYHCDPPHNATPTP